MSNGTSDRLVSLDVFRGITIAGMILVNNPGDWGTVYAPLLHAKWHGCTPTDLIFPFFLFIVGVAITLSLTKRKMKGDNMSKLYLQITRRALILFFLGLFSAAYPFYNVFSGEWVNLASLRIPGVLQRIGVVYFVAAILFLNTNIRTQAITGAVLLLLYWILMSLVPVPGVGYANLEPTTNLAAYFDNLLLGGHLWSASKVWDPEGILSTLPAIGTAISGIMLGHWLNTNHDKITKVAWIFVAANILLVVGWFWDLVFPLNKSIWTSSYVLWTSGLALHFFGFCYWFNDIKGVTWWTKPFIVYGSNAITVFFLSGLMAKSMAIIKWTNEAGELISLKTYIYKTFYAPFFDPYFASFMFAITYVLLWLGLMWILHHKRIFIKV
ncbi:MAG: DUF5009 domain-containing protein [Ignavibacteriaceae bacterium]|nr:DUF5009 domain-containing protein [Ignavibacteriaceae bacterium]